MATDRKNYVVDQINREDKARERFDTDSSGKNRAALSVEYARTIRALKQPEAGAGRGSKNPNGVNSGDL